MYYVYGLIDPRNDLPFYIGKGKGNRALSHLQNKSDINQIAKNKINKIRSIGLEPYIKYYHNNILCEQEAYDLEENLIENYKIISEGGILTNICKNNRPPNLENITYEERYKERSCIIKKKIIQTRRLGKGWCKKTKEQKDKISLLTRGENNPFYGKKHTEETKNKISIKAKKRKGLMTGKTKIIIFIDYENNYFIVNDGYEKFCQEKSISIATVEKNKKLFRTSTSGSCKGWYCFNYTDIVKFIYSTGMNPYSGLIDLFEHHGILTKDGNKLSYTNINGETNKWFRKQLIQEPSILDNIMNEYNDQMVKKGKDSNGRLLKAEEQEDEEIVTDK